MDNILRALEWIAKKANARIRAIQLMFCLLGLVIAAHPLVDSVGADSTVTVTGGFTTADAGVFSVGVAVKPESGGCAGVTPVNPSFGTVTVDAVGGPGGVVAASLGLCLVYTDTEATRGAFTVEIMIDSFELRSDQIPAFEGADQAHFQIPNRYLVLDSIGALSPSGAPPVDGGTLTAAPTPSQTATFDRGPFAIATAGGASGSGTATQELHLVLNIPAGVYPGEYDSTITIETFTGP